MTTNDATVKTLGNKGHLPSRCWGLVLEPPSVANALGSIPYHLKKKGLHSIPSCPILRQLLKAENNLSRRQIRLLITCSENHFSKMEK